MSPEPQIYAPLPSNDVDQSLLCLRRHPLWFAHPAHKYSKCSRLKTEEHEVHTWGNMVYWRNDTGWKYGPEAPSDQEKVGRPA